MAPTKINFKIYQGSTFKEVLRWESAEKGYAPISNISNSAPLVITSVAHEILVGWRFRISNVVGMKEVNSSDTYYTVSSTTTDTITVNNINSIAHTPYISGGVCEYNKPNSLFALTARMQIRAKIDSIEVLKELTTENGGIIINDTAKTITINISYTDTATFSFSSAVYSMEIVSGVEVHPFINGTITIEKEITR